MEPQILLGPLGLCSHIPHDFVVKLWQEARNQSAWKTEGSLGGIRKSVYNRLRYRLDSRDGPLYQPGDEARLAVEALYKYHLTDTATHRLIRVRRQGVSERDVPGNGDSLAQ